ncbi:hydrophobin [Hanseniaspora osmophila]|uniref:Antiviral helicase SLH1 n=1 Tax=Hanseniaspora osmophila TaxID=56408 RepID=A0A1E5RHU2_9ASCO|nr:Antiviral helicase SLH1 [Hanseniaspora osmophila]
MSTSYSVHSVGSYMQAMGSMVEAAATFHLNEQDIIPPDLRHSEDKQKKSEAKSNAPIKLAVVSNDRNEWDDIIDGFADISFTKLDALISNLEITLSTEDNATDTDVYDSIFSEVEKVAQEKGTMSAQELMNSIMNILCLNDNESEQQSLLFDMLGFDHFDLIGKLLQEKSLIVEQSSTKYSKSKKSEEPALAKLEKQVKYPHVFQTYAAGRTISFTGQKYSLPVGTTRQTYNTHEEIIIPYAERKFKKINEKFVKIADLDFFCQGTFKNYDTLNRMQSLVYPVAYNTNENMLVCAPTGAGKTDVALLTILHTIQQFALETEEQIDIDYDEFKIIYVAPLKALAAEIVEKFQQKLKWIGIQVRELTGDMQLTKAEIMETQVIVTTPEKWDVVTRKAGGDNELVSKVKLLIIDEVHLLHEDRGSVIETLVARTLRQVETSQSMIRILGLSATLPNYIDVADFLGVNRQIGMFYFDQYFRPCPLQQQLLGCRGKAGSKQARENIDKVSYEKLIEMMTHGHQVMVFVNSRKDTAKSSRTFISMAEKENEISYFECDNSDLLKRFSREMTNSRNKDMKELFLKGFGIHHAGMSRSDRNLTEKMFLNGAIRVLCCTATLAWGVNLPAAAVIVKGTQIYDSKKGGFTDMGISDVIQIFGRAGRPQFEKYGIGILCTSADRLDHYVSLLTQQHAIESKLASKIVDNLNAEISLGTVTNVDEGIEWLGYTYLNIRMKQTPFHYGLDWQQIKNDPLLFDVRKKMIVDAARKLHTLQMIVFDEVSMHFIPKDLGRIASDFYLLNESVEIFNQMLSPNATEADVLAMISMSTEFDSIKFREEEATELAKLLDTSVQCQIAGDVNSAQGKTNILLQAYISKVFINDSALASDSNYVAQNSVRIVRALFLVGVNRRWGKFAKVMLDICKSIEKRIWSFDHPLVQFDLPGPILNQIKQKNPSMQTLLDMDPSELGDLVHNRKFGSKLFKTLSLFPKIHIDAEAFPITENVVRISAKLTPDFTWDFRLHGNAQFFWVFVEESDKSQVLHFEKFILNKKKLTHEHEMDFLIPLSDPLPPQVVIKVISDSWIGSETAYAMSFQHLIRPHNQTLQTKLLNLKPLPTAALKNPLIESIYNFKYFNPMQTMVFHTLYHSNESCFVGSPTGSGKTVVAELAIWHAFSSFPGSKIVYIAPMKALVRERVTDWRKRITPVTGDKVVELTGDSIPDPKDVRDATIVITTPEKFDGISRNWQTRKFVQNVSLVIMDEIHLLASDRGPILEMIVSRMNYMAAQTGNPVRLLGMSTAVSNAYDMAGWLGCKNNGLYNFPSSVRPVPLKMYIDGFPDNLAFCPLMKTMNKPAFLAIKQHSPVKPTLIFVASRRQTRLTALDLIHLCGSEDSPRRFLHIDDEEELQYYLSQVSDETLRLALQFGIGLHHAGLVEKDREISHQLFQNGKIQILVATSTLAWGVNLPAHLVVIKGTQFFDAKIEAYRDMDLTDILQMMGRAGRPAYDTSGTAIVYCKENKKMFYKHFLNVGFPVESSLHKVLDDHLGAEISSGSISSKQEAVEFLKWTFLFRRAHHNPTYYGIEGDLSQSGVNTYLSELIDKTLQNLIESQCVIMRGDAEIESTPFLTISSYYYISHKTIRQLLKRIHDNAKFEDVLKWLSMAVEYNELPVRHGEEIMNVEMSSKSRYPFEQIFSDEQEALPAWDPHVKTFLLLQAYFSRVDLPIADYHQDTVSVLDQALRILQAYIDVASELGYLRTALQMIKAIQCLKQGYWFEDDPVTALPGMTLKRHPFVKSEQDNAAGKKESKHILTLNDIGKMGGAKLKHLATHKFSKSFDQEFEKKFIDTCQRLPVLHEFSLTLLPEHSLLKLRAKHYNKKHGREFSVYCDKFPKLQKELWFVIGSLGDELIMIKRVQPKQGGILESELIIPEDLALNEVASMKFILINDALDLSYDLTINQEL